ncbi:hypothetical protein P7C70_g4452, partial [Phenoliferia sp. Uapishka_3]
MLHLHLFLLTLLHLALQTPALPIPNLLRPLPDLFTFPAAPDQILLTAAPPPALHIIEDVTPLLEEWKMEAEGDDKTVDTDSIFSDTLSPPTPARTSKTKAKSTFPTKAAQKARKSPILSSIDHLHKYMVATATQKTAAPNPTSLIEDLFPTLSEKSTNDNFTASTSTPSNTTEPFKATSEIADVLARSGTVSPLPETTQPSISCGPHSPTAFLASVSSTRFFHSSELGACGTQILATRNGAYITLTVDGICESCTGDDMEVSESAYEVLEEQEEPVVDGEKEELEEFNVEHEGKSDLAERPFSFPPKIREQARNLEDTHSLMNQSARANNYGQHLERRAQHGELRRASSYGNLEIERGRQMLDYERATLRSRELQQMKLNRNQDAFNRLDRIADEQLRREQLARAPAAVRSRVIPIPLPLPIPAPFYDPLIPTNRQPVASARRAQSPGQMPMGARRRSPSPVRHVHFEVEVPKQPIKPFVLSNLPFSRGRVVVQELGKVEGFSSIFAGVAEVDRVQNAVDQLVAAAKMRGANGALELEVGEDGRGGVLTKARAVLLN